MTWRRIAVYYTLSLILGGYYWAVEWRPNPDQPVRGARPVARNRFLPIAQTDIYEITLRRASAVIHCRRKGDIWETLAPPGTPVTSSAIVSLLENLTLEKEVQIVEQAATDFVPYGLAQPYATLELKGPESKPLATITIGGPNPTDSAVYVRKDASPQVALLGSSVRYSVELIFTTAGFGTN